MSDQSQNQGPSNQTGDDPGIEGAQKDPSQWTTGGEGITGPQLSYLTTLAQQAGEEAGEERFSSMTKAEASEEINRLREAVGVAAGDPDPSQENQQQGS